MDYAIKMENVTKYYIDQASNENKVALKFLNLKIKKASIFGLLGPNGAGKSTTINILSGLTNKTAGKVFIENYDQDINPEKSRSCIGVVPQELNLDPFLCPRDALEIQAGLFGVKRVDRKTSEILNKVGLMDASRAYARSLSGGMRRRLLIAKALVHSPPIVILDEPTAGVDIELREMLWDYILELNSEGTTIVLTTHYLEEAQKICTDIGILSNGVLVEHGETKTLLEKINTKVLIIHTNEKLTQIPALPYPLVCSLRSDGALQLFFDKSIISTEEVIDICRRSKISIKDIATAEPALEDVFKLVTKR